MDGNWLFYTFNHLVFRRQLTVEEIRLKIWDFILRDRNTDQNIWEGYLKNHIQIWEIIEFRRQVKK